MTGILEYMALQGAQQPSAAQPTPTAPQQGEAPPTAQGDMHQMYQFLMNNAMKAISEVAEEHLSDKNPIDGVTELVSMALLANLQAAQQGGKRIPPQVMLQVAFDLTLKLLQELGAPQDRIDDLSINILMEAIADFGEKSNGLLSDEEEQQYVQMIEQIATAGQQQMAQVNGTPQHTPQEA